MQKYLEAGKVVTTHGVRGEMKAWSCAMARFLKKVGRLYTTPQGGRCYRSPPSAPRGRWPCSSWKGSAIWMPPVPCGAGALL